MRLERKILRDLYKASEGLFAYTFYNRYRIAPETTASFIKKFEEKDYVKYTDGRLYLTDFGKKIIYKKEFSIKENTDRFSGIPDEHKDYQISINEPYIPNAEDVPIL